LIVGPLLAAALLGASGAFTYIALDPQGRAHAATRPEIDARSDVRFVWKWSEDLPPERVPLARIDEAPRRLSTRLAVSIDVRADASRAGLELVAAPLRMWQEVPEPLLPRWPVPEKGQLSCAIWPDQAWGVRLVGRESASTWTLVEPGRTATRLTAGPAAGQYMSVISPTSVEGARVLVYAASGTGASGPRLEAVFVGDKQGRIKLPAWPKDTEAILVVSADELAPAVLHVKEWPPSIARLDRGCLLRGTVRNSEGEPVSPVNILVETWVAPGVPIAFHRTAVGDATGVFCVRDLPRGEATVTVVAKGLGVVRRSLVLKEDDQDLGQLELVEGRALRVRALESSGSPIAGAFVSTETAAGYTDGEGVTTLRGLRPASALKISAKAAGFLQREQLFMPPLPEEVTLVLERGLLVRGLIVDADGEVLTDAEAMIRTGCESFGTTPVPVIGGRFEATVNPVAPGQLVLRSPASLEVTLELQPGEAGEERDLGTVTLPSGATATGVVVAAADHTPLAGARVSALRTGTMGPLVAAALGDVLSTSTAANGSFRLQGLRPGTTRVEVAAPGYASKSVVVAIEESGEHDVGTIELTVGATVVVRTRVPTELAGAVARIRPAAQPSESGSLASALEDGEASLPHVPAGPSVLSVVAGNTVVCEKNVHVPDKGVLRVDCPPHLVRVRGKVRMGGAPAGAGVLLLASGGAPEVPEAIVTTQSSTGLRQQHSYLARPRPVEIPTRHDGSFGPHPLRPGHWEVTFHPAGAGSASSPQGIEIVDAPEAVLDIDLPGLAVAGVVVDEAGRAVPSARITAMPGGAAAITGVDGRFALVGLPEGRIALQARLRDLVSEPVWVEVERGKRGEPVQLRLAPPESDELTVVVDAERGLTAAGGLVIVEMEGRGTRFATAGEDGRAMVSVARPYPQRVRCVAFTGSSLALGSWTSWEAAVEGGVRVRLAHAGRLEIVGADAATLRLAGNNGEDATTLLRQVGILPPVADGLPVVVGPLPPGFYSVSNGTQTLRVEIRSAETARVSFH